MSARAVHHILLVAINIAASAAFAADPDEKLPPGKQPGTFHLEFHGQAKFVKEPMFPVSVAARPRAAGAKAVAEKQVTDDRPFIFAMDLPPGSYYIYCDPTSKPAKDLYWGAIGAEIHINSDGALLYVIRQDMTLDLKLKFLSPAQLEKVDAKRPILKWQAVPNATEYWIGWHEIGPGHKVIKSIQAVKSVRAEYQFEEDVIPKRMYEWYVHAQDANGVKIAHMNSYFLTAGADLKEIDTYEQLPVPKPGTGFLGVAVKEEVLALADMHEGHTGLLVLDFTPGSSASRSDLRIYDLILKVDGKRSSDVAAFITQVSKLSPGSKVKITIWRQNLGEKEITVEVGKRPEPVKQEGPK